MCRKHVASQLWLGGGSYVQASRLKTVAPSSFMNGYQLPATRGNQAFGGLAWSYKVKMETFRCKTYALAYALASLLLTACAGDIDRFMENYKSAEGKDIDAVVKEIGMPDREGTIMGYKAYFWENTSHYSLVSAVPNTTTFSSYTPAGPVTTFGSGMSYQTNSGSFSCSLKMIVNKKGIVQESSYAGAPGGCQKYGPGLAHLAGRQ